jgi:hypothetical protein
VWRTRVKAAAAARATGAARPLWVGACLLACLLVLAARTVDRCDASGRPDYAVAYALPRKVNDIWARSGSIGGVKRRTADYWLWEPDLCLPFPGTAAAGAYPCSTPRRAMTQSRHVEQSVDYILITCRSPDPLSLLSLSPCHPRHMLIHAGRCLGVHWSPFFVWPLLAWSQEAFRQRPRGGRVASLISPNSALLPPLRQGF